MKTPLKSRVACGLTTVLRSSRLICTGQTHLFFIYFYFYFYFNRPRKYEANKDEDVVILRIYSLLSFLTSRGDVRAQVAAFSSDTQLSTAAAAAAVSNGRAVRRGIERDTFHAGNGA